MSVWTIAFFVYLGLSAIVSVFVMCLLILGKRSDQRGLPPQVESASPSPAGMSDSGGHDRENPGATSCARVV